MIPIRVYAYAALVALVVLIGWQVHHRAFEAGRASAELVNAKAIATANALAVQQWKDAAAEQARVDAEARDKDRKGDSATAAALLVVADKYAKLANKPTPPGRCDLSAEWIRQYNEAR